MQLGCIGDDFTGSSDLANTLAKAGMSTTVYCGTPQSPAAANVEASIVALKSRTCPVDEAVDRSLEALEWLQQQGCQQFFFKYCSTFDSTKEGNIGPVIDALISRLHAKDVIVCPAFPGTGRTLYQGHLFVNDRLLNESGMENHPLTPMTDSDIRRWLGYQTNHKIGHVSAGAVRLGTDEISNAIARENAAGHTIIVVDAVTDHDLLEIGSAIRDTVLITGGSGLALGLPANFGCTPGRSSWQGQEGKALALSGSCSNATRLQVETHGQSHPVKQITVEDVVEKRVSAQSLIEWAMSQSGLPLISSSADTQTVSAMQEKFGRQTAADALDSLFAEIAVQARDSGFTKLITAGGETSGAIVEGLSISELEIGPEIDPGVPCLRAGADFALALKSGNFGASDFFSKAERKLTGP